VDQQGPQISVASFADAQQRLLAAAGTLSWYQP
jgi:hypothetical protein